MSRIIKEFKIKDFDSYNLSELESNPPVFMGHLYEPDNICGKVVHISERRKIINVEFYKFHRLYKTLQKVDLSLELDLVHEKDTKIVRAFVVYLDYGKDNL